VKIEEARQLLNSFLMGGRRAFRNGGDKTHYKTNKQFLRKLPKGFYHKSLKTMVRLSNGSLIEAFLNNPETIRGPISGLVLL